MSTIHQEIDELLAADLHDELRAPERQALHTHLVECASCRQLHKEQQAMNKLLQEQFAQEKPDAGFEQRILSRFREAAPGKGRGLLKLLGELIRVRSVQITAAAALLLVLAQVGRMLTGDRPRYLMALNEAHPSGFYESGSTAPVSSIRHVKPLDALSKKDSTDAVADSAQAKLKSEAAEPERVIVTGSNIPTPEETGAAANFGNQRAESATAKAEGDRQGSSSALANRKLIRNASVELEVASFDAALQKITAFASEDRGYIATTNSRKQENGKLRGQVVVKVLPENLDRFLGELRGLGDLKNQSISTVDVTKAYFDTDSRLRNGRVMEERLVEILKKKSEDINDLLQVEKELGRVRQEIEQMQGELKFMDAQVQFATVSVSVAEKDMNVPAAFLLKEHAQLALYAPDVEKIYNDIKAVASPKVQITNAQMDRNNAGQVSARISLLIAPEESEGVIGRIKAMGRVENFQVQTDRVAQGGEGMSESATTQRDKVQLDITLSRDEQEPSFQQTNLSIRTGSVDTKAKELRTLAEKQNGRVRSSSFNRDWEGRERADVVVRLPMRNYPAFMQSLDALGRVENLSIHRNDQSKGQIDEANAPVDISTVVYSTGNLVSQQSGLLATLRRTVGQGASALAWSASMIGVALAFIAPWAIAVAIVVWVTRRIRRARRSK